MTKTWYVNLMMLAGLIVVYWISSLYLEVGLVDDSYIFLRYAENFTEGSGLVFNKGEHVEGFTSPLWVLLLGMIARFELDLVFVSKFVSAAFGASTLIMLFYTGQTYLPTNHKWLAIIPGWFLATTPAFVYWTWSAMDTALYTFLFFCTFVIFLKQISLGSNTSSTGSAYEAGLHTYQMTPTLFPHSSLGTRWGVKHILFWSGMFFFLATFARLGMVVVLPVYLFFIYYFHQSKDISLLRSFLVFLLPLSFLLPYILWRYSFYQALLPNTYYAKAANIPASVLVSRGLIYTINFLKIYGIYLGLPIFIVSKGIFKEWSFALAIIITWLGYVTYVGGDHFSMFRFYTPILPIVAFLLLFVIKRLILRPKLPFKYNLAAGILTILVLSVFNYAIQIYGGGASIRAEIKNAEAWSEVGYWLDQNLPEDAKIATVVVGAIPYYSGLMTYDLTGLTNRHVARQGNVYLEGKVGHQKYHTDYILAQRPDYIISPASGLFLQPVGAGLDKSYNYSLYHLITDERALQLYEYQAVEMDNGKFVEFLQLKNEEP